MTGAPPRFPEESPVQAMRLVQILEPEEGGRLVLPGVVRWALGLDEGALLALEEDDAARFQSYTGRVRRLHEAVSHPWPYVEELLRRPLAAVGPAGALVLPEEIARRQGDAAVLRAWVETGRRGFSLEPFTGQRVDPELWAQARYMLPVAPDFRVRLPADARWALSAPDETVALPASLLLAPRSEPGSRVALIVTVKTERASWRMERMMDF